jgi:hypothetical protein
VIQSQGLDVQRRLKKEDFRVQVIRNDQSFTIMSFAQLIKGVRLSGCDAFFPQMLSL